VILEVLLILRILGFVLGDVSVVFLETFINISSNLFKYFAALTVLLYERDDFAEARIVCMIF